MLTRVREGPLWVTVRCAQLVQGYMNLKLGVDKVYAEMEEDYSDDIGEVSLEEAIEIIQRNERGRQGKLRAGLVKRLRVEELRQRCVSALSNCRRSLFALLCASTLPLLTACARQCTPLLVSFAAVCSDPLPLAATLCVLPVFLLGSAQCLRSVADESIWGPRSRRGKHPKDDPRLPITHACVQGPRV